MFFVQCIQGITTSYGLGISMLLAGLVGGVTHCAGMCSPFVLAQMDNGVSVKKASSALLLPYHLGRMTTYIFLAVLVNTIINVAFVFSDLKSIITAPMLILAGVIFLISAFPKLLILFPWAGNIRMSGPYNLVTRASSRLMRTSHMLGRYGLGVLLGFLPCGLVAAALLASGTAENALTAGLAMGAFAIGTMPALMLVAFGGQKVKSKYPRAIALLSRGAMTISGFWLFILAGSMVL